MDFFLMLLSFAECLVLSELGSLLANVSLPNHMFICSNICQYVLYVVARPASFDGMWFFAFQFISWKLGEIKIKISYCNRGNNITL